MPFFVLLPRAEDIERWADSELAASELPRLVRRLIVATTNPDVLVMVAGKAVRFPGWDGIIEVENGNHWVPAGRSNWELSTGENPNDKAQQNYRKRTDDETITDAERKASVFVFVTPRRWEQVATWVRNRGDEGVWRGIKVLTADDLDGWLEKVPHVAVWLRELINGPIAGIRSLEAWWNEWRELSVPFPISSGLVLSGRVSQAEQIREWLSGDPATHAFRTDSIDEGIAVIAAALLPDDLDRDPKFASALVIDNADTWRDVITLPAGLILIAAFAEPWTSEAVRRGHHVLVPAIPDEPIVTEIELPQITVEDARNALIAMQIGEDRAEKLAHEARGGLLPIRRLLATGSFHRPEWAGQESAPQLTPALLAVSWDAAQPGDREVLEQLGQGEYFELTSSFEQWARSPDPPLRQRGTVWVLSSKRDAWMQLSRAVTSDQWKIFEEVVIATMGSRDPAWDLPEDQRWTASVKGKHRPNSGRLLHGLAETTAILGASADFALPNKTHGQDVAARIVRTLLGTANESPTEAGWGSLSDVLSLLAEAAPGEFLDAVERGATGDDPVLARLMADHGGAGIFSKSYHAGLLWGLEVVSWSPGQLARAARLLARLAAIDPGGKWANRPAHSLLEILLPQMPQNTASTEQRVRILETIRKTEPAVAWQLFVKMLDARGVVSRISMPRWNAWPTRPFGRPSSDALEIISKIVDWLVEDAANDGSRWAELVEVLDDLKGTDLPERILTTLEELRQESIDPTGITVLMKALRDTIGRHRAYADKEWALPSGLVDRLEAILQRLQPSDAVTRTAWLFGWHPDLELYIGADYKRYDETWHRMLDEAIGDVLTNLGWAGVEELVGRAENPHLVGWSLGRRDDLEIDQLRHWFESDDPRLQAASDGFIWSRTAKMKGWLESWARDTADSWSAAAIGRALAVGAPNPAGWSVAESLGMDIDSAYWARVDLISLVPAAWEAAPLLRLHGRPSDAVSVLGYALRDEGGRFDPDEVYDSLAAVAQQPFEPSRNDVVMFQYHLSRLLRRLNEINYDEDKIALLEWQYLPLLEHGERRPNLLLHREMARNPEFFVTVISALYRARGDAAKPADARSTSVASNAFTLLHNWDVPPGMSDGSFDPAAFRAWMDDARARLAAAGRLEVGESEIGKVLWRLPPGDDGYKPPVAVRDYLDEVKSDRLDAGFHAGVLNSRGVTTRDPKEGGRQERELAVEYRAVAEALADGWDRITRMYSALAETYEKFAEREDNEAQLNADEY